MESGFYILIFVSVATAFAPLIAWVVGRLQRRLWIKHSRKILGWNDTIVAQYQKPANLKPAEIAYLYDQSFGEEELLATLFDLEKRGKVKLLVVHKSLATDFI